VHRGIGLSVSLLKNMKKIITSVVFIAVFSTYALYLHAANPSVSSTGAQVTSAAQTQTSTQPTSSNSSSNPGQTVAVATPAEKPKGQYVDGTYTGASENAFYGNVQVKVTISGGTITDVVFLDYPQDRGTSRMINAAAIPQLKEEAITAQSAQVDGVSGASDTSQAFIQSLSSALSSAKA
jgi:uncharacterized protein with FMN-binding domain